MMGRPTALLRGTRTLFAAGTVAGLTDGELLLRFVSQPGDVAEAAFAALVARHGPMVLGACRRMLANPHDAEDAFQATFLVLVRQARSVKVGDSLAPWLYGVSHRVALRVRADASRRRARETSGATDQLLAPEEVASRWDLRAVIDDELARLPGPYRAPVVLCYLEGLSLEEAARQLRCPVGTIKSRLSRAREQLSRRLTRRGLAPLAGTLGGLLGGEAATARMIARLADATVQGAMKYAIGNGTTAGTLSASVNALTKGVLRTMLWTNLMKTAGAFLVLGSVGVYGLAQQSRQSISKPGGDPAHSAPFATTISEDFIKSGRPLQVQGESPEREQVKAAELALEKWLEEPIKLDGVPRSFKEMVALIRGYSWANVVVDHRALVNAGATLDTVVYLPVCTLQKKAALRLFLQPLGMAYRVENKVIMLTSPLRLPMVSAAYSVGDLIHEATRESEKKRVDMIPLVKLLTSSVAPVTWMICDESGNILNEEELSGSRRATCGKITLDAQNESLIVHHTKETQEEVRLWLDQFRNPDLSTEETGPREINAGTR